MKKTNKTRKMIRSRIICKFKSNVPTIGHNAPTVDYTTTTTTATTTTGFN